RAAEAITRMANHAEVFLPEESAVEVVAVQTLGAQRHDDSLPVGGGSRGGEGALEMPAQAGWTFIYGPLPDDLTGRLVEAQKLPGLLGPVVGGVVSSHAAGAEFRIRPGADCRRHK